jgi:hypothetical protein
VFLHDEETLNYFFYEFDQKDGIPSLPNRVLVGPSIPRQHPTANKLKKLGYLFEGYHRKAPKEWRKPIL